MKLYNIGKVDWFKFIIYKYYYSELPVQKIKQLRFYID